MNILRRLRAMLRKPTPVRSASVSVHLSPTRVTKTTTIIGRYGSVNDHERIRRNAEMLNRARRYGAK